MPPQERTQLPVDNLGTIDIGHLPGACAQTVVDGLLGDVRDLQAEVRQLQQALVTRAAIDQAKGVLMLRYGVDDEAAFGILARWSSVTNVKLRVVAQALVEVVGQDREPSDRDVVALVVDDENETARGTRARVGAGSGRAYGSTEREGEPR